MAESYSSLLCVVIDLNPLAWGLKTVLEAKNAQQNGKPDQRPETIVQGLDAVLTFINSFMLMTHGNKVAVIGVHPHTTEYMYPSSNKDEIVSAAAVNQAVSAKFRELLVRDDFLDLEACDKPSKSRFASGLGKALCYINRRKAEDPSCRARVLVLKCGMDPLSNQYLALVNGAFAAQEMDVKIDTVVLDRDGNNAALQQVSAVSNGVYSQVREPCMLLQILLVYHLADDATREKLSVIPQSEVDARATCFKTHRPVDIGHVCSVCLSVYSIFTPICDMCDAVYRIPQHAGRKRKRPK